MTAGRRSSRGDDQLRDEVAVHREAVAEVDDAAGEVAWRTEIGWPVFRIAPR
ncbi:hypothetical protein ACI79J_15325 [Geodermatophilus sp. SYSU D01062]